MMPMREHSASASSIEWVVMTIDRPVPCSACGHSARRASGQHRTHSAVIP